MHKVKRSKTFIVLSIYIFLINSFTRKYSNIENTKQQKNASFMVSGFQN